MSEEVEVSAEPEVKTLPLLTKWVKTQEKAWGPILRIGTDSGNNAGAFDWDNPANPKPTIAAVIEEAPGDADEREGELCRGEVFLGADLKTVIVFRPKA